MKRKFITKFGVLISILSLIILAACGSSESSSSSSGEKETESKELTKAKLVTNWFAQPEHGGNYAALQQEFYKEEGLDMTVEPGGPQVSATQIVASGEAQFGYTQAEDLLIARDKGIPLVAIGAIFQKSPQVLITHEGTVTEFEDLNGKTVYTAPGSGYWEYIKSTYNLTEVKEMSYTGSLATFIEDKNAVTQGYVTSEPYSLDEQGVKNDYLFIHDSGFETYGNIIFTTEKVIKENPELVHSFMDATVKGWNYYRENWEEVNPIIRESNPELTLEKMEYAAKTEEELIFGGDAEEYGFGYMSEERWSMLQDELLKLEIIKNKEDITNAFTVEFLEN
ncbi:ABC transporter substrate-binding protein [Bacillus sp. V2I10]|uniref:ABC transporter substrate-binding protein n=1 Tax=Bacillus sp. V2I10 TaxID=3042276 RepID=UPI00277F7B69|nr:ABC transporter substrate-binding protein [Bacillus sp. V2I10]MDQ0859961.1 NitT/TauT family transport system substrate-binding protein [Bacillus sp. V2I10]